MGFLWNWRWNLKSEKVRMTHGQREQEKGCVTSESRRASAVCHSSCERQCSVLKATKSQCAHSTRESNSLVVTSVSATS